MVQLTLNDRLLAAYIFYGSILLLKTFLMSFFTAKHRIKNKAFPSPEDYGQRHGDENKGKPVPINEDVERVRRAHHNDLENIPIFLIIALLYMLANLSPVRGIWCLRIFTAARILHTISYLNGISKPRAIGFMVGSACMAFMLVSILCSTVPPGWPFLIFAT